MAAAPEDFPGSAESSGSFTADQSLYGVDFVAPFSLRDDLDVRPAVGGRPVGVVLGNVVPQGAEVWRSTVPPDVRCWSDGIVATIAWSDAAFAVTADSVVVDAKRPAWTFERYLNPVWALVLSARGAVTFHGFGAALNLGSVAIMGRSGYGKSSLGLALVRRGGRLIADDMLALGADGLTRPGPRFVRLDTDRKELRDPGGKERRSVRAVSAGLPLNMVIVFSRHATAFEEISRSTAAVDAVLSQVYTPFVAFEGGAHRNLSAAVGLATTTSVYACPRHHLPVEELADRTEALLAEEPALGVASPQGRGS